MLKIPYLFGWLSLGKEEKIGRDIGIWTKYSLWKPYYGMEIAVWEEFFFDSGSYTFSEQEPIRKDYSGSSIVFEESDNQNQE